MYEAGNLNNIFSSLIPVKNNRRESNVREKAKPFFKIEIREGEPFITLSKSKLDTRQFPASAIRVYNEIQRISEGDDIFGLNTSLKGKVEASLWENPYILNLVENQVDLEGFDGKMITFSDQPAVLILSIKRSESSSQADVSLLLRVNEKEKSEFHFLADTRILAGNVIYKV
ncbi:MAG: hypothetical protein K2G23_05195, partial [Muribaculaceae bacterium]|nr:hypothetical protein [Muribaculaceae bacterium]